MPGTFTYNPVAGTVLSTGKYTLTVTFTPANTSTYKTATASVNITVTKANPVIAWSAPASIVVGTALGANQLNATANVPGSFVYNPPAGTVLPAGTQSLAATFTPNDTTDYAVATATNSITVTDETQAPTGPVVSVDPSMSTQEIQSALNGAPSGATISFAAGVYTVTTPITVPCANLQLTGPVSDPPTATLSASFNNQVILGYNGGCSSLGAIRYLGFANTGAVYFGIGNNSNFTFDHNTVSNLPSNLSNLESESGLFFDGNLGTTLSNILIQYNTFGDANSCGAVFATLTDQGGYCAGVTTSQGENNDVTIQNNIFQHVEEGIHFNQLASWNPGAHDSVCVDCTIDYNYVVNFHRIGIEIQVDTPTDPIMLEHNAVVDPLNSFYGTFATSLACCQWGAIMGTAGNSPGFVFNDNLLIASQPCGAECPPYGVEFWGTGSQGSNSLIEGNFSNGYAWGFGAGSWEIINNYICGPNFLSLGGYITNEENQINVPSLLSNVSALLCQATTSSTPTIAPSGGFVLHIASGYTERFGGKYWHLVHHRWEHTRSRLRDSDPLHYPVHDLQFDGSESCRHVGGCKPTRKLPERIWICAERSGHGSFHGKLSCSEKTLLGTTCCASPSPACCRFSIQKSGIGDRTVSAFLNGRGQTWSGQSRQCRLIDVHQKPVISVGCVFRFKFKPCMLAHRADLGAMIESPLQGAGQIQRRPRREEQSRSPVGDDLSHTSEIRGNHWKAFRESFCKHQWECFKPDGRKDERHCFTHEVEDFGAIHKPAPLYRRICACTISDHWGEWTISNYD